MFFTLKFQNSNSHRVNGTVGFSAYSLPMQSVTCGVYVEDT